MRHHTRILLCAGILIIAGLLAPAAGRAESSPAGGDAGTLSVELGLEVATGNYGNTSSTTTISVPLSLLYLPTSRLDLGLSVPFIRQNNDLVVGGRPVPDRQLTLRQRRMANSDGAVRGIGDLVLSAGYALVAETDTVPQLRPVLTVKLPTASTSLGTGALDVSPGLGLAKSLENWYLYLSGDYTFQGKTSLFTARDFAEGECGVGYEVVPGLRPSLGVRGATPVEVGVNGTLQVEGKLVYAASRAVDFKLYLDRGLTVTSPDWQGGCSLAYNF